jgi:hypothetical protein
VGNQKEVSGVRWCGNATCLCMYHTWLKIIPQSNKENLWIQYLGCSLHIA